MSRFSTTKTPWRTLRICGTSNGPRRVLGRDGAEAPRVAAGERDAARREPFGDRAARPGLAGEVDVGVVPVRAPAGVEEDGVARRRVDAVEVLEPDDVAAREALDATRARGRRRAIRA